MSDTKLKEAMAEIRSILERHDIGAAITLVSETHSEFLYELEPSWSVLRHVNNQLRFRSRRKDFKTQEGQRRCTENSVHLLCQIRDMNIKSFADMQTILDELEKHFDIEHTPLLNEEVHRDN